MKNEYVAIIIRQRNGGSYLTAYNSESKYWGFPGGKPEEDETWSEALVREVQEELGITPTAFQYIGTLMNDHNGVMGTGRFFLLLTWDGGDPRIMEPHKFSRMEYFTADELRQRGVDPEFKAVARYERQEKQIGDHIRQAFEWCRDGRIDKAGRAEMLLQLPA